MDVKSVFKLLENGQLTKEEAEQKLLNIKNSKEEIIFLKEITPEIIQIEMNDIENRNMFSEKMVMGLIKAFSTINNVQKYKVAILKGTETHFSCGGTKDGMLMLAEGKIQMTDINIHSLPIKCNIPVIAAIEGHAVGGGWCLGMFCDFVIMSLESRYMCNHMEYGFTPGDGATLVFPEKLGWGLAQEILFLGRSFRGNELKERSSITIVPRKEVYEYAMSLAHNLVRKPKMSLVLLKRHMNQKLLDKLELCIEQEWQMQKQTLVNNKFVQENLASNFILKNNSKNLLVENKQLNLIKNGTPVIWIHDESGNIDEYRNIAMKCKRPFFAIKLSDSFKQNLKKISMQDLIENYIREINQLQIGGACSLGGTSIGGILAYETAKQLQNSESKINSIILVDPFVPITQLSKNYILFKIVNTVLIGRNRNKFTKSLGLLISPREVNWDLKEEIFLRQLITLGKKRGLSSTTDDEQLFNLFWNRYNIESYFLNARYQNIPLDALEGINCLCLKSKEYYGIFKQFFDFNSIDYEINSNIDKIISSKNWSIINTEAMSHITLFYEEKSLNIIQNVFDKIF